MPLGIVSGSDVRSALRCDPPLRSPLDRHRGILIPCVGTSAITCVPRCSEPLGSDKTALRLLPEAGHRRTGARGRAYGGVGEFVMRRRSRSSSSA